MRTRIALVALALITLPLAPARAESVDDIVQKNVAAHGGAAAISALKSVRFTGKVVFGGGGGATEAALGLLIAGPRVRSEVSLQGLTRILAFDGREAWTVQPFGGRVDPEKMPADGARGLAEQAETFVGVLLDARAKGHRIEALGTEDVDGTAAIKLRVTRKDGDSYYLFLDPDSYLEIRVTTVQKVRGVEQRSERDLGGYQQVAGVWFPFAIEDGEPGGSRNVRFTIAKAEPNVAVTDAMFAFPTAPATRLVIAGPDAKPPVEVAPPAVVARPALADAGTISGLGARNIGSAAMSGRVAAVAARIDRGATTIFVGAASGGVWRSRDGGTTFDPVFDRMPVQSIGAIAIDPTTPSTIWVGTGEAWTRNSVSVGDGIYKSTDGGETWTNMGLPGSERIVKILVHPKNGNVVYACVPGKLWSDSKDRGVYKTSDGGKSWALVLPGANLSTGCSGLTMDPANPDVLIAGTWDFRRQGWTFRSGGDGPDAPSASGMSRTTDGGKTWTPMTAARNKGLPAGPWGRVEVVIAPSDAKVVYALIESKASALYRSSDGGATWEARDRSQMMVWRPFYFARLIVDPTNADRVFKPDLNLIVSEDGGKSFSQTGGGSHGDWHDVWIDPTNTKHVIGGDDGGFWTSYDGGNRWWKSNNLPISQFYHVSVDDQDPYKVYGGLQDNSSWVGDSAYPGGITNGRWENLYGGDGFWVLPDPTDPDAVYAESQGGFVARVDRRTLSSRSIQPLAGFGEKLRFNWNTPLHLSPTRKGTLYIGAQFLFRSTDRGTTWKRISPDLTTNDPAKQQQERSGGVTVDNSSAEMHTTIYAISESPKNARVIWVGTDDGNVQLTRDGGGTWTNVVKNVPDLPAASWVSWIEASRFDAGTAYAAFDRHTVGDMNPWVYRTTDYGKTWTRIVAPASGVRGYAHVIKEDTVAKSLLFLGTELGLWISTDGGATWAAFQGGKFPSVAVREVQIQPRDGDLVIATHGRGIWIVDDLAPLRALSAATLAKATAFLPSRPVQERMPWSGGWYEGDASFAGANPPAGAVISYYLRSRHVYGAFKLEILDAAGKVIDTVAPSKRRGINRVTWTMQVPPPKVPRAASLAGAASQGPRVVPGTYTARLTRGADVIDTKVTIVLDRRAPYTVADRKAQFDAVMKAHALFGEMSTLVERIEATRRAVLDRATQVPPADPLAARLRAVADKLEAVKKTIVATTEGGAITGEERIREHLDMLYGQMMGWEGRPTPYQLDRLNVLRRELGAAQQAFDAVVATDVRALDGALKAKQLTPVPAAMAAPVGRADEVALRCIASRGERCGDDGARAAARD